MRIRRAPCRPHEGGFILVIVMLFGTLASMVLLALFGRLVVEQREVANSLAQTRAYWAAMGVNAYAFSRLVQSNWCARSCSGAVVAANAQNYANEIKDLWTWQYPDVAAGYSFSMTVTTAAPGDVLLRTTFASSGSAPALAAMSATRPLEVMFNRGVGGWGTKKANTLAISSVARPAR